jgi:hypothetical protein
VKEFQAGAEKGGPQKKRRGEEAYGSHDGRLPVELEEQVSHRGHEETDPGPYQVISYRSGTAARRRILNQSQHKSTQTTPPEKHMQQGREGGRKLGGGGAGLLPFRGRRVLY